MISKIDSMNFRKATGKFTTGVAVVTVENEGDVRGMTANSFVSISLEPPLVMVSVAKSASMYDRIKSAGKYGVSVLKHSQQDYSDLFAGAKGIQFKPKFKKISDVPVIDGGLSAFACEVYDEVECGDHILFIGKVIELDHDEGKPLLYFSSGYRSIDYRSSISDSVSNQSCATA